MTLVYPMYSISDMGFAQDRLVSRVVIQISKIYSIHLFSLVYKQGPERVKGLYAFRNVIDSGARITLGTDFPVEEINPLKSFYSAISRLAVDGTSPHGPGGW